MRDESGIYYYRHSRERGLMKHSRFMIAAPGSGSGKTVISCALMSALMQEGLKVAACKCGPDYIDPMFHREVVGADSSNLDLFFCGEEALKKLFEEHVKDADATVVEGVMGYYDGYMLDSFKGSSYDVARTLNIPVILTVNCKGAALSLVPLILGMIEFRKDSNIKGILLNRVSGMLYGRLKLMIEEQLVKRGFPIPVVGYVPENETFEIQSRHLGLITPGETECLREKLKKAGEILKDTVELEKICQIGREEGYAGPDISLVHNRKENRKIRIGLAQDAAFCFYYKENLELLKNLGCELVTFSPLKDERLPEGIKGLLLGGGYPEVYGRALSRNIRMMEEIRTAIESGMPCLAECGGFMYLHEMMEGEDGVFYPMAGVIKGRAYRTSRLVRFGYIGLSPKEEGEMLKKGETLKGHEFHYWDSTESGTDCLAVKPGNGRSWECIHMKGTLFAGYPHIHFYSNPSFARRFVRCCEEFGKGDVR